MKSRLNGLWLVTLGGFLAVLGVLWGAIPVYAHHSFQAEFDADKPVVIKGVLTKIDWINPHIYFYIDVKDDSGKVTTWTVETFPTGFFHRAGLTRDLFNVGDTYTAKLYQAKDQSKAFGWLDEMTLPTGRKIVFGGASSANGAPARPKT